MLLSLAQQPMALKVQEALEFGLEEDLAAAVAEIADTVREMLEAGKP